MERTEMSYREWLIERIEGAVGASLYGERPEDPGISAIGTSGLEKLYLALWSDLHVDNPRQQWVKELRGFD